MQSWTGSSFYYAYIFFLLSRRRFSIPLVFCIFRLFVVVVREGGEKKGNESMVHPLESETNNEWSRTCLKRKLEYSHSVSGYSLFLFLLHFLLPYSSPLLLPPFRQDPARTFYHVISSCKKRKHHVKHRHGGVSLPFFLFSERSRRRRETTVMSKQRKGGRSCSMQQQSMLERQPAPLTSYLPSAYCITATKMKLELILSRGAGRSPCPLQLALSSISDIQKY